MTTLTWPRARAAALDRDARTCRACGHARPGLHVHHLKPRAEGGSHDLDNLVTLCASCHRECHDALDLIRADEERAAEFAAAAEARVQHARKLATLSADAQSIYRDLSAMSDPAQDGGGGIDPNWREFGVRLPADARVWAAFGELYAAGLIEGRHLGSAQGYLRDGVA